MPSFTLDPCRQGCWLRHGCKVSYRPRSSFSSDGPKPRPLIADRFGRHQVGFQPLAPRVSAKHRLPARGDLRCGSKDYRVPTTKKSTHAAGMKHVIEMQDPGIIICLHFRTPPGKYGNVSPSDQRTISWSHIPAHCLLISGVANRIQLTLSCDLLRKDKVSAIVW